MAKTKNDPENNLFSRSIVFTLAEGQTIHEAIIVNIPADAGVKKAAALRCDARRRTSRCS